VTKPALPYLPLTRPTIDEATIAGVCEVLRSGWLNLRAHVKALEAKLSEYFGGRPVRVFNSGTCTMEIALRIAGIGAGHEVVTTPCHGSPRATSFSKSELNRCSSISIQ